MKNASKTMIVAALAALSLAAAPAFAEPVTVQGYTYDCPSISPEEMLESLNTPVPVTPPEIKTVGDTGEEPCDKE